MRLQYHFIEISKIINYGFVMIIVERKKTYPPKCCNYASFGILCGDILKVICVAQQKLYLNNFEQENAQNNTKKLKKRCKIM